MAEINFEFHELNLLNKLLNKVKYSNLDKSEFNEFMNSPITNKILEKITNEMNPIAEKMYGIKPTKDKFIFDSETGRSISERLTHMDTSTFETISKWDKEKIEKFVKDIIGPIDCEKEELNKMIDFLIEEAHKQISG